MDGDGLIQYCSEGRSETLAGIALEVDWARARWAGARGYRSAGAAGDFLFWCRGWRRLAQQRCGANLETDIRFARDSFDWGDCGRAFESRHYLHRNGRS